ncbi:uncharacterized protein N7515_008170 [Penicillium bovifimosum]|uniref:HNH nuclease domain-containing protein n=1 Tax=Penicillium bovifimosum TaxID=126998 RepID=A0A9W9KX46_9EURO|nr:uncharacterized protein N7515_008170 [Penicillium bovifimosum]KAJ5124345.1 hypothetical protein N7515_008170 [Penicillium bovifimosum]
MEKLDTYQPIGRDDKTVQILRAFHAHHPADGRVNFLHDFQSLQTNEQLHDYAQSLINGLVAPLRWLRSTPTISPRLGMEESIENIDSESTEPMARESRLKRECLARDDQRCVVTGDVDRNSPGAHDMSYWADTECVHIIPFSLASWKSEYKGHVKDIIWANLIRHFPAIQSLNFTRENINDTKNAITMSGFLHRPFGCFDFSFEETSKPHTYRLQNYAPNLGWLARFLPATVEFNSYDERYDLPSPELLKVHAIIARIFHASGAAESIEKALRDLGEHSMLTRDGSTDISSMLAATTLGVLGSRATNDQPTCAAFPYSETNPQGTQRNVTHVDRPPSEKNSLATRNKHVFSYLPRNHL